MCWLMCDIHLLPKNLNQTVSINTCTRCFYTDYSVLIDKRVLWLQLPGNSEKRHSSVTHTSSQTRNRTREASNKQWRRVNEISTLNLFLTWEGNERFEWLTGYSFGSAGLIDRPAVVVPGHRAATKLASGTVMVRHAVITTVRHLSLSWVRPIQSTPLHPTAWRSILILSSHLHLGIPRDLFSSGLPTRTLYAPLLSHVRATRTAHLIFLYFIAVITSADEYRSRSSSLCSLLHSPVTSSFKGHSLTPHPMFLYVRDQVSHPYKTELHFRICTVGGPV